MKSRTATFTLLCMLALCSCADPTRRAAGFASQNGFAADTVTGTTFKHRLWRHAGAVSGNRALHVYIEGDGTPFIRRYLIASDPTPRNPMMLRLMAIDPYPSVYVGRPCYFGLNRDGACAPIYWTSRRFSPEVVDSMAAAISTEAAQRHAQGIVLFGHSGGGTLAALLSWRIRGVTRVVTIGANLDIDAWTTLHRYTPLNGSLNPVDSHPPESDIPALHLVGSHDENTPPAFLRQAVATGAGGEVRVVDGFTHACCWERIWAGVLHEIP